ncbi:MAG: nucleotidyltransferase substrate binding protein [Treponema sp.]|jgi:nucleotidyltransferase substrate binding protein (TIGR01987 family)|nr:nucleotidyltransferase substrate binding protein [Treponema sp.]
MIDYRKYRKSLQHLEAQFRNYRCLDTRDTLLELDREGVSESVIHRFEICYDCLWKTLKRYLREALGIPDLPNSPKPVLRIAFENHLLAAIEPWLFYADAQVGTSHDYSETKARDSLVRIGDFIKDALALYCRMTGEPWE